MSHSPHSVILNAVSTITGIARLSGYSRRHIQRLVKAKKLVPGTWETITWIEKSPKVNQYEMNELWGREREKMHGKKFIQDLAESIQWSMENGISHEAMLIASHELGDPITFGYRYGEPNPIQEFHKRHPEECKKIREIEEKEGHQFTADMGKRKSIKRVSWGDIYFFVNDLITSGKTPSYRSLASKLNVSISTISRWFNYGHLSKYKNEFNSLKIPPQNSSDENERMKESALKDGLSIRQ